MSDSVNINTDILNAYIEDKCGGKEYFLGVWSPDDIDINLNRACENIQFERDTNWALLRNGADRCNGLLFPKAQAVDKGPDLVVFRGYLAEAQIHSYSRAPEVRDYWSKDLNRRHNGIFSAVTISDGGQKISFVTDIFGIGALYYRRIGDLIVFSSCTGLLAMQDDHADICSWLLNIYISSIPGNETLTEEIKQLETASVTSFNREGTKLERWYEPTMFPNGEGVVDDDVYALSHKKFGLAVQRCLQLGHGKQLLPLSSGHDSRRIFGHMYEMADSFESCSVQMTTPTGEDIDLEIGEKISSDHGIPHVAIRVPEETQWCKNTIRRILSMDGQTQAHTWSVPLFAHYHDQQVTIFDGIGGDVFGFHGLVVNEVKNIKTPLILPKIFKSKFEVSQDHTTKLIDEMKSKHDFGPNHGLLTFLNSISRKSTSLWAQQQIRPGQLPAYPYLDLDYVEMMFSYSYKEMVYERAQLIIMNKYWPELAAYPSSREIPEGTSDISEIYQRNYEFTFRYLHKNTYDKRTTSFHFDNLLNVPSRIILYLNRFSDTLRQHSDWWTHPLVEYMYWWQRRPFVVTFDDDGEN